MKVEKRKNSNFRSIEDKFKFVEKFEELVN